MENGDAEVGRLSCVKRSRICPVEVGQQTVSAAVGVTVVTTDICREQTALHNPTVKHRPRL
jgi:hypothetical protein